MNCRPFPLRKKGCRYPTKTPGKTLKEIIDHFRRNHLQALQTELKAFHEMETSQAIELSAKAKQTSRSRHLHHTWKKEAPLNEAFSGLTKLEKELRKCLSFAEILLLVEKVTSTIEGLGTLYNYDCALSLGANLGKMPEVVYLHCGTREGAKALGLKSLKSTMPVPEKLMSLKPHEVEDFLCLYKKWLKPSML